MSAMSADEFIANLEAQSVDPESPENPVPYDEPEAQSVDGESSESAGLEEGEEQTEAAYAASLDDLAMIELSDEDYEALDSLTDLAALPDKTEVNVEIEDVVIHEVNGAKTIMKFDKNKRPYVNFKMKIVAVPTAPEINLFSLKKIYYMLYVPMAAYYPTQKDAEALDKKRRTWKAFHEAFDMPMGKDQSLLDFVGKTAAVVLGLEPDEQYGDKNKISRLINSK